MKKITLLVALIVTSFSLNAQKVYDFTGSQNPGSWVHAGAGISVTPSEAGLVFEFGVNTPRIDITRAADPFDVSVGTHMIITLINNNTEVGSFSGFTDKNGAGQSGTNFMSYQTGITKATTPGAGVEKTYVYELTGSNYANDGEEANNTNAISDMEYIGIRFRNSAAANLVGSSAENGNIILKKIQIVNGGVLSKASYDFAIDDIAGFSGTNQGTVVDGGTTLNFAASGTGSAPKAGQTFYAIDASNTFAHVVFDSNTSNADQVKFQFQDIANVSQTYGANTLNIGSSTIVDFPLSVKTEWTGSIKDWRLVFSNSSSELIDTGLIKISRIIFDNNASLATKNINAESFSFYPNPVNSILNLNTKNPISKVQILDATGRIVLEEINLDNNSLDVSKLKNGLYILNVYTVKNELMTTKMLKN